MSIEDLPVCIFTAEWHLKCIVSEIIRTDNHIKKMGGEVIPQNTIVLRDKPGQEKIQIARETCGSTSDQGIHSSVRRDKNKGRGGWSLNFA